MSIKKILLTDKTTDTATWFLTADGDICETYEEAKITGNVVAEIITDNWYHSSIDEWKRSIKFQVSQYIS